MHHNGCGSHALATTPGLDLHLLPPPAHRGDPRPTARRQALDDGTPLLGRVGLLDITKETHTVAESIELRVTTLDAVHLATALLLGEPVTVATHDTTMETVAKHLGLRVTDPVESQD